MSLINASVLSGATITPTGGTALSFTGTGIVGGNMHTLICDQDDDFRTRRSIVCTAKQPKVSVGAPNGLTQARGKLVFKFPKILDNLNLTVETVGIEVAYDSESTVAEVQANMKIACQALIDSDFADFFTRGNLT